MRATLRNLAKAARIAVGLPVQLSGEVAYGPDRLPRALTSPRAALTDEVGRPRCGSFSLLHALYADPVMAAIWSERETVQRWLDVEAALAHSQAAVGMLRQADAEAIAAACTVETIDLDQLWTESRVVGYPILPLVRMIARALPAGPDGRVHYGATTQDIMDTAVSMQLRRSADRLIELLCALGDALALCTERYSQTIMAARTHAQQAVPTTFGAKTATFLAEVTRHVEDIRRVGAEAAVVSLFGGGGTNAALGKESVLVRHELARRLSLSPADVPWHVARDRLARFCLTCSAVAATCVRLAREVIDLSRTEIGEVGERDGDHRGASSTMPQKANPIASESIIGFGITASTTSAGMLRAMEAGHERSAGEWQIEWTALPLVASSSASAVRLAAETMATLRVFPDRMAANMTRDGGLLMAEAVMMRLAGVLGRERAHDITYRAAARAKSNGTSLIEECHRLLPADGGIELEDLLIAPDAYLGETPRLCEVAVRDWRRTAQSREGR